VVSSDPCQQQQEPRAARTSRTSPAYVPVAFYAAHRQVTSALQWQCQCTVRAGAVQCSAVQLMVHPQRTLDMADTITNFRAEGPRR